MTLQPNTLKYPSAKLEEADGVAWIFTNAKSNLIKYPFKFAELEPQQVRIKVLYTSICQSDILTARQDWGSCVYPACPGHEVVGKVTVIGSNVKCRKVDEIVSVSPLRKSCAKCEYCLIGRTNMCLQRILLYGGQWFGGYTTHMQVDQNWVFPVPEGLDLSKTAPILCAGLTVYEPLKKHLRIGKQCAVIGIGGLGHFGLQYGNKLGMQVTAFTTKPERKSQMFKLGAKHIQHSTNLAELKQNEGKYDLVINTLYLKDEQVFRAHLRLTAPGGVYIIVGAPNGDVKFNVDYDYVIRNNIKIVGSFVASIEGVIDTLKFSAEHSIYSVAEEFDFEDFNAAFYRAEKQTPKFRVVVNVQEWAKKNGFDK